MNELVVDVSHLSIQFGEFKAVDDISFSVQRGEIFGFLGANGAGKTTTIRMLCGLLQPSAGTARIAGIGFEDGEDRIKEKVGYMSQRFTLYNDLTVQENLDFTAALRKLPKDFYEQRRQELFSFIEFDQPLTTLVKDLPGGIKQELSLIAAMLHDPDIVFLDEPTAGVSPASRARFWALIRRLSGSGKTVFVTTHYMDEAEQCHRIALMRAGQIIALGGPQQLKEKTFPETLIEIEPKRDEHAWLETVKSSTALSGVQPYGLRFHAIVKDSAAWNDLQKKFEKDFVARPIKPSLEDVFIRLVEGADR